MLMLIYLDLPEDIWWPVNPDLRKCPRCLFMLKLITSYLLLLMLITVIYLYVLMPKLITSYPAMLMLNLLTSYLQFML